MPRERFIKGIGEGFSFPKKIRCLHTEGQNRSGLRGASLGFFGLP